MINKTFAYNFSDVKNYTAIPTLHDFYVSPVPTCDPNSVSNTLNSVSNILSFSTLPDFLTEMSLIVLTLNMLNGITMLNT